MLPNTDTELSQEQKDQIQAAKLLIPKLKDQIRRAASAGIDVAQQQAELAAIEQQLDKLYKVYVRKPISPTASY